jgi:hypothetical protein
MRHNSPIAHNIGQISFIALIFVTSLSFYTLAADAFPDTAVIVEPKSSSVVVGETFSINVTVVDVQNLYGLEVILSWNSTVLALINTEVQLGQNGGVLNSPVYIADNSTQGSRYTVSATSTSPAPSFNGTGNIVRMNFSVIGTGACKLDLQTQLYDYPPPDRDPRLSMPITHTDVDGFFQDVIPEFPGYLFFVATAMLTLLSGVFSKHIFSRHNKTFDKSAFSCGQHTTGEKRVQAGDA